MTGCSTSPAIPPSPSSPGVVHVLFMYITYCYQSIMCASKPPGTMVGRPLRRACRFVARSGGPARSRRGTDLRGGPGVSSEGGGPFFFFEHKGAAAAAAAAADDDNDDGGGGSGDGGGGGDGGDGCLFTLFQKSTASFQSLLVSVSFHGPAGRFEGSVRARRCGRALGYGPLRLGATRLSGREEGQRQRQAERSASTVRGSRLGGTAAVRRRCVSRGGIPKANARTGVLAAGSVNGGPTRGAGGVVGSVPRPLQAHIPTAGRRASDGPRPGRGLPSLGSGSSPASRTGRPSEVFRDGSHVWPGKHGMAETVGPAALFRACGLEV